MQLAKHITRQTWLCNQNCEQVTTNSNNTNVDEQTKQNAQQLQRRSASSIELQFLAHHHFSKSIPDLFQALGTSY
jgi:hypothetical protein